MQGIQNYNYCCLNHPICFAPCLHMPFDSNSLKVASKTLTKNYTKVFKSYLSKKKLNLSNQNLYIGNINIPPY